MCLFVNSLAQDKIKTLTSTARVEFPDYKSRIEVEKEAEQLATIDALERAFGRVVIQGNSTYIKNISTEEQTKTFSIFSMIGNTFVKGEVLEILDKEFVEKTGIKIIDKQEKEYKELECTIKIKARELAEVPVSINISPLEQANKYAKQTSFHNGDTLYLYFQSEEDGYLTIFLDDNNYSYCLLPYRNMPEKYESGMPVEAGKEYILFSGKCEQQYFKDIAPYQDTYILTTNEVFEMNRMFVIFSKNPLDKPVFREGIDKNILSEMEKDLGFSLPDGLESGKFQEWLQKNRIFRKDMQVKYVDVTITK